MFVVTILIAIFMAVVLGFISNVSGRFWAAARLVLSALITASLASTSLLLAVHPGWEYYTVEWEKLHGREMMIGAIWHFFLAIGPKPCSIIFGCAALYVGWGFRNFYIGFKRGNYFGLEDLEKNAAKQAQSAEIVRTIRSLSDANKADESWMAAQAKVSFANREEAERTADMLNRRNEVVLQRCHQIKRLASEWKELNPEAN
jgi:hypothetical protein